MRPTITFCAYILFILSFVYWGTEVSLIYLALGNVGIAYTTRNDGWFYKTFNIILVFLATGLGGWHFYKAFSADLSPLYSVNGQIVTAVLWGLTAIVQAIRLFREWNGVEVPTNTEDEEE